MASMFRTLASPLFALIIATAGFSPMALAQATKPAPDSPRLPAHEPKKVFTELFDAGPGNGKKVEMKFDLIAIPGGKFTTTAGAKDGAAREVEIKPLWIGKCEVSWDEYSVFCYGQDFATESEKADAVKIKLRPSKPYGPPDRGFGLNGYAAISMTYNAAEMYCRWLSIKTGKKYRLPTEEEWEYACRAGGGADPLSAEALGEVAWYRANSEVDGVNKPHEIASKKPNAWGLYDMLGNAAEWCSTPDATVKGGALRGGNYDDKAADLQPTARKTWKPSWQKDDTQDPKSVWWLSNGSFAGMRVVCEP